MRSVYLIPLVLLGSGKVTVGQVRRNDSWPLSQASEYSILVTFLAQFARPSVML